jgi:hypothetical protein
LPKKEVDRLRLRIAKEIASLEEELHAADDAAMAVREQREREGSRGAGAQLAAPTPVFSSRL